MKERLWNLLCIKSIITLVLLVTFVYMTTRGIESKTLEHLVNSVIMFYFGTQASKKFTEDSAAAKTETTQFIQPMQPTLPEAIGFDIPSEEADGGGTGRSEINET
ncbi:MAG: hypothetical protein LBL34_04970 [Clostridiales bacterium]|jgi:hypothetical protein|nr:hypothetical protein [Clostridiales bacterium]